jgi:trimethylamine:corrinoid methyltransferase-like protein
MVRGIGCSSEQLAVDVYQDVKPLGNFLRTKHTKGHFRKELWDPKVTCRKSFSSWVQGGKTISMKSKIRKYIETQLDQHQSPDIPDRFHESFGQVVGEKSSG